MSFGAVNHFAVLGAAVASFVFGGLWYTAFSRRSLAHPTGTRHQEKREGVDTVPFIVAFVALLVMAYVLAGFIGQGEAAGQGTVRNGIVSALLVWVGFVMTALVINHMVQGINQVATLVDGGHWLGVLVIQGAVIGWLGA